jgi:hypothetical protein
VDEATALVRARSDGEIHTVAAAARTTDGVLVTGMNLFHFTGGPCAELVVLATAAGLTSAGIETIVAVGDRGRGVLARAVDADTSCSTFIPPPASSCRDRSHRRWLRCPTCSRVLPVEGPRLTAQHDH